MSKRILFLAIVVSLLGLTGMLSGNAVQSAKKILIAHRGASGYTPEHTLAAFTAQPTTAILGRQSILV